MARRRGFLLKIRVRTLFRRVFRQSTYRRLEDHRVNPVSSFINWTHRVRNKAKSMLGKSTGPGRSYIRVGQEPFLEKPGPIPKGQIAVYVGEEDGDFRKIFVPVVYFNHPLFGDLLKESENEFGFKYPGGITLPCRISEFERVQTRIKAVQCTRKLLSWR